MERVIVAEVLNFLGATNLINRQQHSFLRRRSTGSEMCRDWTLAINDKQGVAIA